MLNDFAALLLLTRFFMTTEQTLPLYIGLDIEGKHLRAAVCDPTGQILTQRRQTVAATTFAELITLVSHTIQDLQAAESDSGTIIGVGFGVPGLVNLQTNQIESWSGFPGLSAVAIYDAILRATQLPIVIDHHSNVAAYGEWQCGVARGFRHIYYVDLGQRMGSSMILNGLMWRGATGYAGEIGFTTIDLDGERTLESYVSGASIVRRVQKRLHRDRTSSLSRLAIPRDREMELEDVVNSARAGDELAQVVIERTGLYFGVGLSGIINLLNPELIVIGGVGMAAGDLLLKPVIAEAERRSFEPAFKQCRIVAAQLGINSGMIGAAMLARDSLC